MPYRLMADGIVVIHLLTVGFVVLGGLLVLKWKRAAWAHLPIVAWVIFAECFQKTCPLTYLEDWLRERGSMEVYHGDFVAHYLMPVLYPDGLTARIQITIGVMVLVINLTLYAIAFWPGRAKAHRSQHCSDQSAHDAGGSRAPASRRA